MADILFEYKDIKKLAGHKIFIRDVGSENLYFTIVGVRTKFGFTDLDAYIKSYPNYSECSKFRNKAITYTAFKKLLGKN